MALGHSEAADDAVRRLENLVAAATLLIEQGPDALTPADAKFCQEAATGISGLLQDPNHKATVEREHDRFMSQAALLNVIIKNIDAISTHKASTQEISMTNGAMARLLKMSAASVLEATSSAAVETSFNKGPWQQCVEQQGRMGTPAANTGRQFGG